MTESRNSEPGPRAATGQPRATSPAPVENSDLAGSEGQDSSQRTADWKVFRVVVGAIGALLAGIGVYGVLLGTAALPDALEVVNPTLESSYRFLAALLVGVGAAFVAIAVKFEWANILIFVCSTIFLGGLARVISWAISGLPNVLMILMMIAELVVPPVIVVWYLWINRTQQLRRSYQEAPAARG